MIALYALLAGAPAVLATVVLLHQAEASSKTFTTVLLAVGGAWLVFAAAAHVRVVRTLQTVANLLSALREGDFSVRGRGANVDDPLGDVMTEINTLSQTLNEQRLGAMEATALLRTVMAEIEVAIFAFDERDVLRLVNPAGQKLMHSPAERLLDRTAAEIGLDELLEGEDVRVLEAARFAGAQAKARWSLRRSTFRERGVPHTLVVVSDVSQALREEEIKAWQRLVRVLGHELNNSLAPIKSIAGSLGAMLEKPATARASDWEDDMRSGLGIVAARADGLTRFMQAYARLTRLPPPALAPVEIGPLVRRTASLEVRLVVHVVSGPEMQVQLDAAQIEQVLINLIANATEAALEAQQAGRAEAGVELTWQRLPGAIEIMITDAGPGIANPSNLFVPFFTTKQKGSGIGLVLCRQIAENHGGSITLENRTDGPSGCIARLRLPL
ncbi:MAG: PAS domain-containing sensor histidine kinase [Opitutaceae bacterium]|nr:PAS domain-containing sensor histidine kinase [Opitutaceae bacterium]